MGESGGGGRVAGEEREEESRKRRVRGVRGRRRERREEGEESKRKESARASSAACRSPVTKKIRERPILPSFLGRRKGKEAKSEEQSWTKGTLMLTGVTKFSQNLSRCFVLRRSGTVGAALRWSSVQWAWVCSKIAEKWTAKICFQTVKMERGCRQNEDGLAISQKLSLKILTVLQ